MSEERKTAKLDIDDYVYMDWKCTACGCSFDVTFLHESVPVEEIGYCPFCGAEFTGLVTDDE